MTTKQPDRDPDAIDEAVLALMWLNALGDHGSTRAWKTFPWEATDRLFEKGLISDPKSTAKSVTLSDEGARRAEEFADRLFAPRGTPASRDETHLT